MEKEKKEKKSKEVNEVKEVKEINEAKTAEMANNKKVKKAKKAKEEDKKDKKSLNKKELLRAVKYLLFASSAGAIQVISFTILNEFVKWAYWPSYLIALFLSVVWNFTLNRKYTFRTVSNVTIAMLEILGYYALFTPLSTLWGEALVNVGWNEYIVLAFTMIINLVTEYLFYLYVVYNKKIDNALTGKKKKTVIRKPKDNVDENKQKEEIVTNEPKNKL